MPVYDLSNHGPGRLEILPASIAPHDWSAKMLLETPKAEIGGGDSLEQLDHASHRLNPRLVRPGTDKLIESIIDLGLERTAKLLGSRNDLACPRFASRHCFISLLLKPGRA